MWKFNDEKKNCYLYSNFNLADCQPLHIFQVIADSAYFVKSTPPRVFSVSLAHLSRRLNVNYCDQSLSVIRPSIVHPQTFSLNDQMFRHNSARIQTRFRNIQTQFSQNSEFSALIQNSERFCLNSAS